MTGQEREAGIPAGGEARPADSRTVWHIADAIFGARGCSDLGPPDQTAANDIHALLLKITDPHQREQFVEALLESRDALERLAAERTAVAEQRAAQLQAMALKLTQAEQLERSRVARFLHDNLQQLLVGAKMNLGVLRGQVVEHDLVEALAKVDRLLDESLDASRRLATDLSPPILHDGGLAAALGWLARQQQSKYGLAVEVTMEDGAEPASHTLREFLFDAVKELLANVVQHAGVGRARVQLRREEGFVEVRVGDEGAGFQPGQMRTAGGLAGGFGLLSLRERAELLGGSMQVCSAPGCGTVVSLRAPLGRPEPSPTAQAAPSTVPRIVPLPRTDQPPATGGRIRVLLADDHRVMRQGLAALLQIEGDIEVVGEAADGREAVELAHQLRPDVVVMDVTMPRMSGVEATRTIAAEMPCTRVIGLSMHDEADMAARMIDAGAEAYLNKAGPSGPLLAAIRGRRA